MEVETRERTIEDVENGVPSQFEVAPDVLGVRTVIVNVYFVGNPGAPSGDWVLVDAGLVSAAATIRRVADERFGTGSKPRAIVLTHGHFDHVGAVLDLAEHWDVPIYAHEQEMPYLTGQSDYPPADTTYDPGLMAQLAPFFPRQAIDLGTRVRPLPPDGSVPPMPEWNWIHTPGHTPGHVSFFRERDRVLIAGDAITTVRQESARAVLAQRQEMHGPPSYFTPDWPTAWESVKRLADLRPSVAATAHGLPMGGDELSAGLDLLAREADVAPQSPQTVKS